eukprot:1716443-Pyramimonas_sp.AAC.1
MQGLVTDNGAMTHARHAKPLRQVQLLDVVPNASGTDARMSVHFFKPMVLMSLPMRSRIVNVPLAMVPLFAAWAN